MTRLVAVLAAGILRLYPRPFRRRFQQPMHEAFVDRVVAARRRGLPAAVLVAARSLVELAVSALREHASPFSRTSPARRRAPHRNPMDSILADLRFALRSLRNQPAFTIVALATLAVAIGASTAVFTVVNGVLLQPLPYPEPDRILALFSEVDGNRTGVLSEPDIVDLQEQVPGLELVVGYQTTTETFAVESGELEAIQASPVTGPLLRVFGLLPRLGRDFEDSDGRPQPGGTGEPAERVAIVSHAFFEQRLGGDPAAVGATVQMSDRPVRIVGVAPSGFAFPEQTEVWFPIHYTGDDCGRGCGVFGTVARRTADATLEQVRAEVEAVSERLAVEYPETNARKRHRIDSLAADIVREVRAGLWMLMTAALVVLAIACANVANLLLVRGTARAGEIAVRSALGAGRTRIVRQLLLESLVLTVLAATIGTGLAVLASGWLQSMAPADMPRVENVRLDGVALSFAVATTLVATLLSGLLPAWSASAGRIASGAAAESGRVSAAGGRSRALLLIAEVALSLLLMLGAGLLLRSFVSTLQTELGYDADGTVQFELTFGGERYRDPAASIGAIERLEERLRAIPGVTAAGAGFGAPLHPIYARTRIRLFDRPLPPPDQRAGAYSRVITPGYLDALGLRVIEGRALEASDRLDSLPVALVSRAFAEQHFAGRSPLGTEVSVGLSFDYEPVERWQIVGVVEDVRSVGVTTEPEPEIYMPEAQMGSPWMVFIVRTGADPDLIMPAIRDAVREAAPGVPIQRVTTLRAVIDTALAPARYYMSLLVGFAVIAVVLAAVGLYGVVAYAVTQRQHEIAVRMALGAGVRSVVGLLLRQGARPMVAGIVLGLGLALVGARSMASLLYGVSPYDPVGWTVATAMVAAVGVLALVLPATRAGRVSPARVLRGA